MSLCLIDVHGDIEGDFEWVEDLPKNRGEFLIAIAELKQIKAEFDNDLNLYKNEYDDTYNCSLDYIKGIITCKTIIDKHITELKGEQE